MKEDFSKFLIKHGIEESKIPIKRIESIEIDVTAQSSRIIKVLDDCSLAWSYSQNRYGGATELVSIIADYWTILTMLYAMYKICNSNIAFFIKVKGSKKPVKMLIADYLRYLSDIIKEEG